MSYQRLKSRRCNVCNTLERLRTSQQAGGTEFSTFATLSE